MFVTISPAQLDEPVKVCDGLSGPVKSEGQTIVAEYHGDVVVFNRDGNRDYTLTKSDYDFNDLSSIAVDDDNIYFTSNKIYRYNKNKETVEVHEVRQVQGPGHWDISVLGDKVVACERNKEVLSYIPKIYNASTYLKEDLLL